MQQITGIGGAGGARGAVAAALAHGFQEQEQLQPEPRTKPDIRVRTLGATNNCDRLH